MKMPPVVARVGEATSTELGILDETREVVGAGMMLEESCEGKAKAGAELLEGAGKAKGLLLLEATPKKGTTEALVLVLLLLLLEGAAKKGFAEALVGLADGKAKATALVLLTRLGCCWREGAK